MSKDETILRFDEVDFEYNPNKPILDEVSFSVRQGMKRTIMGQVNLRFSDSSLVSTNRITVR